MFLTDDYSIVRQFFSLPVKIQGDYFTSDIYESEYDKQNAISPEMAMGKKSGFKNSNVKKSNILVSICNISFQIMNHVSIYCIIPIKNLSNTSFFV
jgi:hypothetical protein